MSIENLFSTTREQLKRFLELIRRIGQFKWQSLAANFEENKIWRPTCRQVFSKLNKAGTSLEDKTYLYDH